MKKIKTKTLLDLNNLDNYNFIVEAYILILNRFPDLKGLINYSHKLQTSNDRAALLLALYRSVERRTAGIKIQSFYMSFFAYKIFSKHTK